MRERWREDPGLLFSPSPVGQMLLVSIQGEAALMSCMRLPMSLSCLMPGTVLVLSLPFFFYVMCKT